MGRTKKLTTHWPIGKRPYQAYRYHNTSSKKRQRSFHRRVRTHNKNKNQLNFVSISQKYGSFKSRDLSWMAGELYSGKWNMKQLVQNQSLYLFNQQKYEYAGRLRKTVDLIQAAKKQIQRRGKIGVFLSHRNPLQLYKHQVLNDY